MAPRIGIAGISGRMGQLLVEEVRTGGAELIGGTSRSKSPPSGITLFPDISALAAASDVVIDFTNAATAQPTAAAMAKSGKAWVLGTSGLSDADEAAVADAARQHSRRLRLELLRRRQPRAGAGRTHGRRPAG